MATTFSSPSEPLRLLDRSSEQNGFLQKAIFQESFDVSARLFCVIPFWHILNPRINPLGGLFILDAFWVGLLEGRAYWTEGPMKLFDT